MLFTIQSMGKMTVLRWKIAISAPRARVWAALCDFPTWPAWFPGVRDVAVPGGAPRVGGGRLLTLVVGRPHHERFAVWEEGRSFAVVVTDPPLVARSMRGQPALRDAGAGTVLDWELRYEPRPGPAGRVLDRGTAVVLGLVFRVALARLRRRVESGG